MQSLNDILRVQTQRDAEVEEAGCPPCESQQRQKAAGDGALRGEIVRLLGQNDFGAEPSIRPRPINCPIPLTSFQSWIWSSLENGTRPSVRGVAVAVRVVGRLDVGCLKESLSFLIQRHEALRTRFVAVGDVPQQKIVDAVNCDLDITHLDAASSSSGLERAALFAEKFASELVSLSTDPLFKAGLLRLSAHEHVLIFSLDHMITDSISNGVISREIWTLYHQAELGRPLSLPKLSVQFGDYAVWQEWTYEAWRRRHEKYWRQKLLGAPYTRLPADNRATTTKCAAGVMLRVELGKHLSARLRQFARNNRLTVSLVMLAIYIAVMARWCNQSDIVIAMPSNGRWCSQLVEMVGFLVNVLLLRVRIDPKDGFQELLDNVVREYYSACDHQDFNRVLFDISGCVPDGQWLDFNWLDTDWVRCPGGPTRTVGQLRIEPFQFGRTFFPHKLSSWFSDTNSGIDVILGYNADLLTESTVAKIGRNLRYYSEELTTRPNTRLVSLPMVS